jgi:hypothetical protein
MNDFVSGHRLWSLFAVISRVFSLYCSRKLHHEFCSESVLRESFVPISVQFPGLKIPVTCLCYYSEVETSFLASRSFGDLSAGWNYL